MVCLEYLGILQTSFLVKCVICTRFQKSAERPHILSDMDKPDLLEWWYAWRLVFRIHCRLPGLDCPDCLQVGHSQIDYCSILLSSVLNLMKNSCIYQIGLCHKLSKVMISNDFSLKEGMQFIVRKLLLSHSKVFKVTKATDLLSGPAVKTRSPVWMEIPYILDYNFALMNAYMPNSVSLFPLGLRCH